MHGRRRKKERKMMRRNDDGRGEPLGSERERGKQARANTREDGREGRKRKSERMTKDVVA